MTAIPQLRTLANEERRERELLDRLARIGKLEEGLRITAEHPERYEPLTSSMWKNGIEPVAFDEFCFMLDGMYLFERQADAWDVTHTLRASQLFDPKRTVTEWLLIWSKRGGKDYVISKYMAYLPYVLSHFAEDPCAWMAKNGKRIIAPGTSLDVLNVAPTEALAKQVFYKYMKRWFKHPLFKSINISPSPEKISDATSMVSFPDINLNLYCMSSNASGLDGYNLFAWIMDEADEFLDNAEKSNADKIHNIFRRTANTTFGSFPMGVIISYPRYTDGFIMRMKKRFELSPDLFYVDVAPIDKIRPDISLDDPEIVEEFANDPAGAAAMYLCSPMEGENVFFTNAAEKMPLLIDESRPPLCRVEYRDVDVEINNGTTAPYVAAFISEIEAQPGCEYFLTVDAGHLGDTFAICVGHIDSSSDSAAWLCPNCGADPNIRSTAPYERIEQRTPMVDPKTGKDLTIQCGICGGYILTITPMYGNRGWWRRKSSPTNVVSVKGQTLDLPHVYEDLLIELKPKKDVRTGTEARPVNFPYVQNLCRELITSLNIVKVRADKWQMIQMIQTLQAETGVDADKLEQGNEHQMVRARLYKVYMENHMMSLRANDTRDREVRRLIQKRSGIGVDHQGGVGESKDLYDAESMMIYTAASHACTSINGAFSTVPYVPQQTGRFTLSGNPVQ